MKIEFVKSGNKYEAEFEATSDFNVHIEKTGQGGIEFFQRTVSQGQYDLVKIPHIGYSNNVLDYDFTALVYPKWIKIVSEIKPTNAEVTFA